MYKKNVCLEGTGIFYCVEIYGHLLRRFADAIFISLEKVKKNVRNLTSI